MKILFYSSAYQKPEWARYQHTSVSLAEGFRDLGIEYYGNIDYWYDLDNQCYLIQKAPEGFDPDVVIYSSHYLLDFPEELANVDFSKKTVLIDNEDGWDTPAMDDQYKDFDLILRCHLSKKVRTHREKMLWETAQAKCSNYLPQVKPWNFGLSYRMINAIDKFKDRPVKDQVLCNFRMPHNLRDLGVQGFNKVLDKKYKIFNNITETLDVTDTDDHLSYWSQTGRRHNEVYYKDINESKFNYAFGGKFYYDPIGHNKLLKLKQTFQRGMAFLSNKLGLSPKENTYYTMTQYGGWRLFESFLSNTVPIQIDFDYWDLDWPVMPEHGKHYWAVKGFRFEESAKELDQLSEEELQKIVEQGRQWVLDNYHPKVVAERFLSYIEKL